MEKQDGSNKKSEKVTLQQLTKMEVPPQIHLINAMTPIEQHNTILDLEGIDSKKWTLYIKRDDMTDLVGTGNKIRKLEFTLGNYQKDQLTDLITAGAINSNHCRAVAFVGAKLGLKVHLILHDYKPKDKLWANTLVNKMLGAEMYPSKSDDKKQMEELKTELEAKNKKPLIIVVGASDHTGCWGYINCFLEIINQNIEKYTDIVTTFGSGGTIAGLAIGNYMYGQPVKIHCLSAISESQKEMKECIQELVDSFNLKDKPKVDELVNFMPSAVGIGYTKSTQDEFKFIHKIASNTGIILDRTYTGKGMYYFLNQIKTNEKQFKGKKILFVLTGGLFTLFDQYTQDYLSNN